MSRRMAAVIAAIVTGGILIFINLIVQAIQPPDSTAALAGSNPVATPVTQTVVPQDVSQNNSSAPAPQTGSTVYSIPADQAVAIALNSMRGAKLIHAPELVNYQGQVAYEVQLDRGTVYVDANSGRVLTASNPNGPITLDQAIQAASAYSGGGTATRYRLERENGRAVYRIQFSTGRTVYVDMNTGQVVGTSNNRSDDYGNRNEQNNNNEHTNDDD